MAIQFRLPEDVRTKYDLPEWVEYDQDTLMLSEAIAMQDTIGVDPLELNSRLVPSDGSARDMRAWGYVIWLACHRAGAQVEFADFDLNLYALQMASESAADDAGPKETETDDPSIPESSSGESEAESVTS